MIQYTTYDGPLWLRPERSFYPALEQLVTDKDHLLVLSYGQPPYTVSLGVPHQTGTGDWRICENRRDAHGQIKDRPGDDNTVSFVLVAFDRLRQANISSKVVIMAHPTTHDPNKDITSPYCQEIFRQPSALLFECHACSKYRRLDLELSAGRNYLTPTVCFGREIAKRLQYRYKLGAQNGANKKEAIIFEAEGKRNAGILQLPARKTASLIEAERHGMPALHLEAKPFFRQIPGELNTVSPAGHALGRAIAGAIRTLAYKESGFRSLSFQHD
ncbi:hypothetical protein QUF63_10705 [Anaerolineales bacterium HSG25]|nr:hypothetical protein [Anaerolineales bacterium HSG25]